MIAVCDEADDRPVGYLTNKIPPTREQPTLQYYSLHLLSSQRVHVYCNCLSTAVQTNELYSTPMLQAARLPANKQDRA